MLRHALTLTSVTLLASACGAGASSHVSTQVAAKVSAKKSAHKAPAKQAVAKAADGEQDAKPTAGLLRKVGDFHVYQYAGAFSKQPLTLTEQVVAKEGDVLVVDFVFEEEKAMNALRVRMKADNEVASVTRITADGEVPATLAEYDALMQKTQFVPDSNDEAVGTEHTSCLVGDEQVDCDVTTYKVTLGRKQAKLSITRSSKVPGRDIAGEVVAPDGKVLFSARLVERGNEPPVVEQFAKLDK